MPRDLTSGFQTAVEGGQIHEFYMIELVYDVQAFRLTTLPAGHDVTWNGYTWTSAGELLKLSAFKEQAKNEANKVNVTMNGLDSTLVAKALTDYYQGRRGRIYLGLINTDGTFTIEPLLMHSGYIDNQVMNFGETCEISVTIRDALNKALDPRETRYTDEDQKERFPGDTGFRLVNTLPNYTYSWGAFITNRQYAERRASYG